MDGPRPVLPERTAEIDAAGGKLKFVLGKQGDLEIHGNRTGLKALAAICSGLSESDDAYTTTWMTFFGVRKRDLFQSLSIATKNSNN